MDILKKIAPIVLGSLLFGACSHTPTFSTEIAKVDSLLVEVNNFQLRLDSINPEEVAANLKAVHATREFVIANYKDSADRKFWGGEMGHLSRVEKAYKKYQGGVNDLQTQLNESRTQLENLRNSLEDEKLSKEEATAYLQTETEIVLGMKPIEHKLTYNTKAAHIIWEAKKPYFDSIIVSLGGTI